MTLRSSHDEKNRPILINGRFLTQQMTGVQRVAREITAHLDGLLSSLSYKGPPMMLVAPPGAICDIPLQRIGFCNIGKNHGSLWEQVDLAFFRRDLALLNLGTSAPVFRSNQFVTVHDMSAFANPETFSWVFRNWYHFMQPKIIRKARGIFCNSSFTATELKRYIPIADERIVIVPLAVDHIIASSADRRIIDRLQLSAGKYILAVGNLSLNKNLLLTLRALPMVVDLNLKLAVVGGHQDIFIGINVPNSNQIVSCGIVTDTELRALYESALCLVYPSLYEGFGIPPLEAMSLGCPVIATARASLPEVCGDAALYCDSTDPSDLADKIRKIATEPEMVEALRKRGFHRSKKFNWRHSAEIVLDALVGN